MSNIVKEVKDDGGIDFKDFKIVQTVCLNFRKDQFDILRFMYYYFFYYYVWFLILALYLK